MRPSRRSLPIFTRRWSTGHHTVTALLIALQLGAFVSQWLMDFVERDRMAESPWFSQWLALDGAAVAAGSWWQFLTFGLLQANFAQLICNILLLFYAGREVESIIGGKHIAGLFVAGNLLGGISHWLVMPEQALMGTSAGMAAVVAAYGTVLAEFEVEGRLFFLIPFKVRAKFLALTLLMIAVVGWTTQVYPGVGPAGVSVACVFGWLYARQLGFGGSFWWQRRQHEKRMREQKLQRMSADQFVEEEVDPILEKIAREGVESLTRSERELLERGSAKITERETRK